MNMRLIMLSHVTEQHINNHAAKPAQFRHLQSPHISRFIYLTIPFGKNPQKSARREIKSQRARLVCNQNSSLSWPFSHDIMLRSSLPTFSI